MAFPPLGRRLRRLWPPRRGGEDAGGRSGVRYAYVTLGLVVVSLVSLSAVPMLLYEKSACPVATVAEPTEGVIAEIESLLALESFATSSFLLTGDAAHTETYRWLRERRRRAVNELAGISEFGPKFEAKARRMRDYFAEADRQLDAAHDGRLAPRAYVVQVNGPQSPYALVTESTAALRDEVAGYIAQHRQETRVTERRAGVLSMLSTMLAIAAVVAVARLGGRYRLSAKREYAARARSDAAYAEAEQRRNEIERVSASREVLMRGFSHDLGNPLVAADWHLRLLQAPGEHPLAPAHVEAVSSARQSIKTAIQLVADLLDLARAEAGQIRVRRAPIDIGAVTSRVLEEFKGAAEGKGLTVRRDIADGLPAMESDQEHVRQILSNLLANAINYTAAGEIAVRVRACGGDDHGGGTVDRVAVEVSDTGPGLDTDQQQNVFKEFYRVDMPGAPHGTGIGLAISSRLAVALGGKLGVKSEPGRGSTFVLELPVEQVARAA